MPKNSPIGFVIAFFATVVGFALIWHIWWMAVLGLIGILVTALVHGWRVHGEVEIPVETLMAARAAREWRRERRRRRPRRGGDDGRRGRSHSRCAGRRGPKSSWDTASGCLCSAISSSSPHCSPPTPCSPDQTAGGPSGVELFDRGRVFIETACLLASSFTCGLFSIAIERRSGAGAFAGAVDHVSARRRLHRARSFRILANGRHRRRSVAQRLPVGFFRARRDARTARDARVCCGSSTMMAQIATLGFRPMVVRRLFCFACSGTRSISSGSACSRSSTWEPTDG